MEFSVVYTDRALNLMADEFQGVIYDARSETPGWSLPGYFDRKPPPEEWKPVVVGDTVSLQTVVS